MFVGLAWFGLRQGLFIQFRLASNWKRSSYPRLPRTSITSVYHHTWLLPPFLEAIAHDLLNLVLVFTKLNTMSVPVFEMPNG